MPDDRGITCAGGGFEAGTIENLDRTAGVVDQLRFFQKADGHVDAGAAHSQHVRQEFLSQADQVSAQAVLAHQEPAGHALVNVVQAVASGDLCGLAGKFKGVALQLSAQHWASLQCAGQVIGANAECAALNLNDHSGGAALETGDQRQTDKALAVSQPNFNKPVLFQNGEHRSQSTDHEISVDDGAGGFVQDGMQRQRY